MPLDEAREWLLDVGLDEPLDEFGDEREIATAAREALGEGASKLVDELRLSLDFYGAQEGGAASRARRRLRPRQHDPGPPRAHRERARARRSRRGRPQALSHLDAEDAARLTVSYGLALEE